MAEFFSYGYCVPPENLESELFAVDLIDYWI
jgi:hypothetical protein